MKPLLRIPKVATLAVACLMALPLATQAKDKKNKQDSGKSSHNQGNNNGNNHGNNSQWNNNQWGNNQWNNNRGYNGQNVTGQSVGGFILTLANGYAGRGYYYGPPNTAYYNRSSQVRYYATREAAPAYSMAASVQMALSRQGYYRGPIDGDLGPMSRRAIANYQADRGLRVTGYPSNSLFESLGL